MTKTIGERIKELRNKLNLSADDLALRIGKNRSTIYRYENSNIEKLPVSILEPLARALETTPAYIMGISEDKASSELTEKIIKVVSKLNKENQNKTHQYATNLLNFQNRTVKEVSVKCKVEKLTEVFVTEKVAAGIGYCYGNNEVVPYYTDRDDLMPYDMATLVFGDSMEPELLDGDVILLQQGYDNVNGDIYVIDYDGKSYVKKLYNDGNRFVLKSINKKYSDIIIYTSDIQDTYFNIVGKVVDSFTPIEK